MSQKLVIVTFKLFPGKDDDLIEFLKSLGSREKSSYIRLAIRRQFITGANANCLPMQLATDISIEKAGGSSSNPDTPALSDDELAARLDRW